MTTPRRVVFVGAGHAVLEATARLAGDRRFDLTVVSPERFATYSGSVPAHLAGLVPREAVDIPLEPVLGRRGVRLVLGRAVRIGSPGEGVTLADGRVLRFDNGVVAVGSSTRLPPGVRAGGRVVPVRPMTSFPDRLRDAFAFADTGGSPRLAIVGGGAAAVELALCLARLDRAAVEGVVDRPPRVTMVAAGPPLGGFPTAFRRRIERRLSAAGVLVRDGRAVGVEEWSVVTETGERIEADVSVWATGPGPPTEPAVAGSARDADGFLRGDDALRIVGRPDLFAAGDCVTTGEGVPRAGVTAVRQGPVLAENLRRVAAGRTAAPYRPQRRYLALTACGDGTAVGSWRSLAFAGRPVWWWKRWLDGRFVAKHR